MPATILVAGATGDLGLRMVRELRARGATVRALVRPGAEPAAIAKLQALGAEIATADFAAPAALGQACHSVDCVVSALNGVRDVIIGQQTALLQAAVSAGVPRFIPSDYALDFTKTEPGTNRNLDLRREFHAILDRAPIRWTSVLCGAFADLLTGQAPFILYDSKRVPYWGSADQKLDFTTRDDAAAFTAAAAIDPETPKFLRIAGDQVTARELAATASELAGKPFKLTWFGTVGMLAMMGRVMRLAQPAPNDPFPDWQGVQYLVNMFSGKGKLVPLDNARYPGLSWTPARATIAQKLAG